MRAIALSAVVLGGCLSNPTIEVDQSSLNMPRGTSQDVLVTVDGEPANASELLWTAEDAELVTITRSPDGRHLRIGGNLEGETVVHVSSYGQDLAISTRVGPPALVSIWTEPAVLTALVDEEVPVHAKAFDTLGRVVDVTFDSRWLVRDDEVVHLDASGMMVRGMQTGHTTIAVSIDGNAALLPVTIFK